MTFVSLRLVISNCVHFPEKNTAALSFLAGKQFNNSIAYIMLSSSLPLTRHLCWLHPLATVNSVAVTTHVQIFSMLCWFGGLGVNTQGGTVSSYGRSIFSVWRNFMKIAHMCVCAAICMCESEDTLRCLPLPSTICERAFPAVYWPVSVQGFSCLCLPSRHRSSGITDTYHHSWLSLGAGDPRSHAHTCTESSLQLL